MLDAFKRIGKFSRVGQTADRGSKYVEQIIKHFGILDVVSLNNISLVGMLHQLFQRQVIVIHM